MSATLPQAEHVPTNTPSPSAPPVQEAMNLTEWFPSNKALDESRPIFLGGARLIQPHNFRANQERYFSRCHAACEALQEFALGVSEDEAWKSCNNGEFGLSPPWWAFWRTVAIPELMLKIRSGVPCLSATILGNEDFELSDIQYLPKFPHRSIALFGSYFLYLVKTKDSAVVDTKAYIGKSDQAAGVFYRIDGHERIINRGGAMPKEEQYIYVYGTDPNTSLESVGMVYRSHCHEKVENIAQVVEGINIIIFNMIVFHVPGRINSRVNSRAVERLVHKIRRTMERAMADGINMPDLQEMSLNRSFPFAEFVDFNTWINHTDEQPCSIPGCRDRAEYCINPLNSLQGAVCSEHTHGKIPKECCRCGLPSDPEVTDTPFRVSPSEFTRQCITCYRNHTRQWYHWDTAEATARLLFPEFREYHLAQVAGLPPDERWNGEGMCSLCLHTFQVQGQREAAFKCPNCTKRPPSCNHSELREWSITHFRPDGGRDTWFRTTAIHLREGIGFIPYISTMKPNSAFMSGVFKVPSPINTFYTDNIAFLKNHGVTRSLKRTWFPENYQKVLDLRAAGISFPKIAREVGYTSKKKISDLYTELTTSDSGTWNASSDEYLLKLVHFFGPQWEEIERHLFQKSAGECAKRYKDLCQSEFQSELVIDMHFEIDVANKSFRIVSSGYHQKESID